MELYNIIINDPLYIVIAILLALIFIFTLVKKYFKWMMGAIAIIFIYLCYLIYTGQDVPMNKEDFKKQVDKDIKSLKKDTINK